MNIEDTPEYQDVRRECSDRQFAEWLRYAHTPNLPVRIEYRTETNEPWRYAIVVKDTDFWMYSYQTEDEAIAACERMEWNIV